MGTADYCFSFFRKPIQNIEPIRAVGIVDVYRYITGHYAQPQTEALRLMATSPEAKRYKATHFDYCTFSGLFRKRNERELIMHSYHNQFILYKYSDLPPHKSLIFQINT